MFLCVGGIVLASTGSLSRRFQVLIHPERRPSGDGLKRRKRITVDRELVSKLVAGEKPSNPKARTAGRKRVQAFYFVGQALASVAAREQSSTSLSLERLNNLWLLACDGSH